MAETTVTFDFRAEITAAGTRSSSASVDVQPYELEHVIEGGDHWTRTIDKFTVRLDDGAGAMLVRPGWYRCVPRGVRVAAKLVYVGTISPVNWGDLPDIDPATFLPAGPVTWVVTNTAGFVAAEAAAANGTRIFNTDTGDIFRKGPPDGLQAAWIATTTATLAADEGSAQVGDFLFNTDTDDVLRKVS